MGFVRNLGSGSVQNAQNWKIYIFSHYLNFCVHNNDKIGKNINVFQFLGFWTDPEPKYLTNSINLLLKCYPCEC